MNRQYNDLQTLISAERPGRFIASGSIAHLQRPCNEFSIAQDDLNPARAPYSMIQLVVLCVVPASLFWYPLLREEGFGVLTLGDVGLICLWLLVVPSYLFGTYVRPEHRTAFLIHLTAVAPGILAAVGSALFAGLDQSMNELLFHLKKFGFASVIPLAMVQCASPAFFHKARYILMISLVALAFSLLAPEVRNFLPVSDTIIDSESMGNRALGFITNPNDLSYIAVCAAVTLWALQTNAGPVTRIGQVAFLAALVSAGFLVVESGSRSGLIGALAAIFYYVYKARTRPGKKAFLLGSLVLASIVALNYSEVFSERMTLAYSQGTKEENFASRLESQKIALQTALENPLGVGFRNFAEATYKFSRSGYFSEVAGSDSIYIDFMLGAGVLGFLALLICFTLCWCFIQPFAAGQEQSLTILHAGCLAAFIFGLATVSPASVFVSPFFFFLVGSAALVRARFNDFTREELA